MGKEKKEEVFVLGGKRQLLRVTYSGIYDFKALIGNIKSYLNHKNYVIADEEHTESVKPNGREIKIVMSPFRDVDEYVKFKMNFIILFFRELDVIVEEDGRKVKKQQGDVEFWVKCSIQKNYKKTFAKSKFGEFMRQTYEKYLTKSRLENYENKLLKEAQDLVDEVKKSLGLLKR